MGPLQRLELWATELASGCETEALVVRITRSPSDRLNASITVNVRRGRSEADLTVWESGEADVLLSDTEDDVIREHLADVESGRFTEILQRLRQNFCS